MVGWGGMDLSPLPESLLVKIERRVRKKPGIAPLVERLLKKRASAGSDEERASVDDMLESLFTPSRFGLWLMLSIFGFGALVVGYAVYRDQQIESAAEAGTPTTAQVERMEPGDCLVAVETTRCLTLSLKLYPDTGAPYAASLTQLIPLEWTARVQPGSWLTVAVDPADPQQVTFDVRTMYVAPPAPPPAAR